MACSAHPVGHSLHSFANALPERLHTQYHKPSHPNAADSMNVRARVERLPGGRGGRGAEPGRTLSMSAVAQRKTHKHVKGLQ